MKQTLVLLSYPGTAANADPAAEACVKDAGDARLFQATYTDKTGLTPEVHVDR